LGAVWKPEAKLSSMGGVRQQEDEGPLGVPQLGRCGDGLPTMTMWGRMGGFGEKSLSEVENVFSAFRKKM